MVAEEAGVDATATMAADPPQAPRHGRDPPGNGGNFNPDTAKDRNGSCDMQGILNGDYDFLVNKLRHIKQAGYSTEEYNKLNPLEKRKKWFNQQKQKANDPSWRPSRRPSPNVSTRSVAEISALTNDMKSTKSTVDNQKITIAKLTAHLEQSDDDASLFSSDRSV